jgi:ubiquinone/menaquinone biosynthesis C-methylase UbiE
MILMEMNWHHRFSLQASWTREMRAYLFQRCELNRAHRVIEIGCGTGVLLAELEGQDTRFLFGLDIARKHLIQARIHVLSADLVEGDAHHLPYPSKVFDASFCHYFLLWVNDPLIVVRELARITRPGGTVLALAEPDYGGRIDYPFELARLGVWQQAALRAQGADPLMGRRLKSIFSSAGLESVECGVIGARWFDPPARDEWESEWAVIENDLGFIQGVEVKADELENLKQIDLSGWKSRQRILFVPTFYAFGRVPEAEK